MNPAEFRLSLHEIADQSITVRAYSIPTAPDVSRKSHSTSTAVRQRTGRLRASGTGVFPVRGGRDGSNGLRPETDHGRAGGDGELAHA